MFLAKRYLSFLFAAISFLCQSQDLCDQQQKVLGVIHKLHYSPPEFNAAVNEQVLDIFLNKLDPTHIYFLKSDVENFKQILSTGSDGESLCKLREAITPVYKKRIRQNDSLLALIGDKPLSFSTKDTFYFYPKVKAGFQNDLSATKTRLEKRVKVTLLMHLLKPSEENEIVAKVDDAKLKQSEPEERKAVVAKERKRLKALLADEAYLSDKVFTELNDAVCKRCDPHSDYFTLKEKESFEGSLSTEQMSFGFSVAENDDDEITIASLVPGSPAWKCNELHAGDVIISVKWPGQPAVDINYFDEEDFYALMEKSTSTKIQLKVRQKDNTVKTIDLEKEKIATEENLLNSFVLSDGKYKLGYIPLPSFYMNSEDDGRTGCANDVAKEIIKLKGENIQGIILDLRFNGGGSMKEAMDLAGIFIDEGPLAIFKTKVGKPTVLKDLNRGTMYDGPLLVMINNYSASASEFFSAAVQDYNRALLVGSTTYGKGTAQNVFPADTNLFFYKNKKNINTGYAKMTIGKFYRVTGITHQARGIKPDIVLPDPISKIASVEKDQAYVLPSDSVNKKVVFKPYAELPRSSLAAKSAERVKNSKEFTNVISVEGELADLWHREYKMPITIDGARKYYEKYSSVMTKVEKATPDSLAEPLIVENNNYSKELMGFNEYRKEQNKRLVSGIAADIYIRESFFILKDLNIFSKN